ncbi:hypothetical protein LIER_04929 [Lithospermum erythrorhizon]|uniref:Uncharacterized protein n=1 Tax=Lithospermum erythrorhizon TaxID=34254 RepID=A0AAV3P372_LITER
MNPVIFKGVKNRLHEEGGTWDKELNMVLWFFRITPNPITGETPFSLVYGSEALLPMEVGSETAMEVLSSPKRAKSLGGVKYLSFPPTSRSTFGRPMARVLCPRASPDRAMHEALAPFLDQGVMRRMANLGLGSRLLTRPLDCGYRLLQLPVPWVRALEEELDSLRTQVSNYHWDLAVQDQELRMAEAERDDANQATLVARREKEGLRHAYLQDSPRRCGHIGAVVLFDFILNCQDQAPSLPALAEEYKHKFPVGWMDNTVPPPPID